MGQVIYAEFRARCGHIEARFTFDPVALYVAWCGWMWGR